jgi:hypothetical protein
MKSVEKEGKWAEFQRPSPLRILTEAGRGVTPAAVACTCILHLRRRPIGRTHAPPHLPGASRLDVEREALRESRGPSDPICVGKREIAQLTIKRVLETGRKV